jgi:predicted HAD superfamily Cof-like phosphohydrolase
VSEPVRNTLFEDVGEFHAKFNLPLARSAGGAQAPALPTAEIFTYRLRFLDEEISEFLGAYKAENLAEMADALVDIVYVALGTAHYLGLPFDQIWAEVQRANMQKVLRSETSDDHKRGSAEVIRKPSWWEPPDIDAVLQQEAEWFSQNL